MRRRLRAGMSGAAMLLAVAGQAAAAPASRQAAYDAAQAAFDKSDWNAAITGFQGLLPGEPHAFGRSDAVIAARLAYALLQVERFAEARALAQRAASALTERDPALLAEALLNEADAARFGFDYSGAADLYQRASANAAKANETGLMLNAETGLAMAMLTIDPAAVGRRVDGLLADKARLAGATKPQLIAFKDLRARAAANAGDLATARRWIDAALADTGGLTTRVGLSQVAIRNDAAVIASLSNDAEGARRYLTFTGAGHLRDMGWIGSYDGDLPVCSSLDGAGPNDTVLVNLVIANDGHVQGAMPVYASRPGTLGQTFAHAVSLWHWNPDLLAKVEPLWRASLVLQLRCESRPKPDGLDEAARIALADWLRGRNLEIAGGDLDAFVVSDDARLARDDVTAIPALLGRITRAHDFTVLPRLRRILDANAAPPSAYALLLFAEAHAGVARHSGIQGARRVVAAQLAATVPPFRARYPDDPATAWLMLEWALALEDGGDFRAAQPILQSVLGLPPAALPPTAPVRRVALLHAALVANKLGDATAARTSLAGSGFTAEQCSLVDTHPVPSSVAIGSNQFPLEAMRWGFEGFARVAYDIGDDGRVDHVRIILAYPPFVFAPSTEQAISRFRYVPPTLDGRSVGCAGKVQTVQYRLP